MNEDADKAGNNSIFILFIGVYEHEGDLQVTVGDFMECAEWKSGGIQLN